MINKQFKILLFIAGITAAIIMIARYNDYGDRYVFSENITKAEIFDNDDLMGMTVIDNESAVVFLEILQNSKWQKTGPSEPRESMPSVTVNFYNEENELIQVLELYENEDKITAQICNKEQPGGKDYYYLARRHYNKVKKFIKNF